MSMKRLLIVAVALAAFVVPSAARADSATYTPGNGFQQGPSGGDQFNYVSADPTSGDVTVLRAGTGTPTGSLGCTGQAGFAYLKVDHLVQSSVGNVTVTLTNYAADDFTWFKVITRIKGGDGDLNTTVLRGPAAGTSTTLSVTPVDAFGNGPKAGDTLEILFGSETSSACLPTLNIDGARGTFTEVQVS
jgi:hypothetical protein